MQVSYATVWQQGIDVGSLTLFKVSLNLSKCVCKIFSPVALLDIPVYPLIKLFKALLIVLKWLALTA